MCQIGFNMRIKSCNKVMDFRDRAKQQLPGPVFDFLEGGADDEVTAARNISAFDDYELLPRYLTNIEQIDTSTTVLGQKIDWPVILSPIGSTALFHPAGEAAAARAAAASGTAYTLSTVATTSIEDVAAVSAGPKIFQIYVFRDPVINEELIERCRAANYAALCLTIDVPVIGNRERDLVSGMGTPPKFTVRSLANFALHPAWVWRYLTGPSLDIANFSHRVPEQNRNWHNVWAHFEEQVAQAVDWASAEAMVSRWGGAFAIKGVLTVEDARRAADIGATAVIVSNHGGRQLDGVPATIDRVAEIADAVGDRVEIILDSGVRRGTHILKAIAMGASACAIGRPYVYGLAAGGEQGITRVLALLRSEVERGMALMGCNKISQLTPDRVRKSLSGHPESL